MYTLTIHMWDCLKYIIQVGLHIYTDKRDKDRKKERKKRKLNSVQLYVEIQNEYFSPFAYVL